MREPILQFITGDAIGLAIARPGAVRGKSPEVPAPRTVGVDIDPLAIRRVVWAIIIGSAESELLFTSAACDAKDIEVVATLADKSQPLSIGRPTVEVARMILSNQ